MHRLPWLALFASIAVSTFTEIERVRAHNFAEREAAAERNARGRTNRSIASAFCAGFTIDEDGCYRQHLADAREELGLTTYQRVQIAPHRKAIRIP